MADNLKRFEVLKTKEDYVQDYIKWINEFKKENRFAYPSAKAYLERLLEDEVK